MKRWIGVLMTLPYLSFSQTSSPNGVIPLQPAAFHPQQAVIIGLSNYPALQGFQRKTQLGIALENKYTLKELTSLQLGIGIPTQHGGLGVHTSLQGSTLFANYGIGFNYGQQLNAKTSIGLGFNLSSTRLKENGTTFNARVISGMAYRINEKTTLAIHYHYDQNLKKQNSYLEDKQEGISIGIGHQVSKAIFSQVEIDKTTNKLHLLLSFYWTPIEKIGLWAGINKSGHLYMGVNNRLKKSAWGIGMANHPQLGYSISLQLNYWINEKK